MKAKIIFLVALLAGGIFHGKSQFNNINFNFNEPKYQAFEKNVGQFNSNRIWRKNSNILFAYNSQPFYVFFTKTGITYRIDKNTKQNGKRTIVSDLIYIDFLNCNKNPEIITSEKTKFHFSYAVKNRDNNTVNGINNVPGFKKIIYKEIYSNIDLVYEISQNGNIEYSFILHENANVEDIQLQYSIASSIKKENITIELLNNQLYINGNITNIIETKPVSYYLNNPKKQVKSQFKLINNTLTFNLENYDKSQPIVIDPFIITPTFVNSSSPWQVNLFNNTPLYVCASGGESPMQLRMYDGSGNLIWVYSTPWDTATYWLGTFDKINNQIYVTAGTTSEIERIDYLTGNLTWHKTFSNNNSEFWSITSPYNEDTVVVGGTTIEALGTPWNAKATVFKLNTNNFALFSERNDYAYVDISQSTYTPCEIRKIVKTYNNRFVLLTHDSLIAIRQDNGNILYRIENPFKYNYKAEKVFPDIQNGAPLEALAAGYDYFYTHEGDSVTQWDLSTGSKIKKARIPNGKRSVVNLPSTFYNYGRNIIHNAGIIVDSCRHVIVGSDSLIAIYDENLNLIEIDSVGFTVYDIALLNGVLGIVGAVYNNTAFNRQGKVQLLYSNTICNNITYPSTACNPFVTSPGQYCYSDTGVIILTPDTPGGYWSISPSTPAFNDSLGTFDINNASTGNYIITYTLSCGSSYSFSISKDSINSTVNFVNDTLFANENNATYQWLDCNNNYASIPNAINQQYAPPIGNGSYAVAISKGGCVDTSQCYNVMITSINTPHTSDISIYPNPIENNINIEFNKNARNNIILYDVTGKVVYSQQVNTTKVIISTNNLAKGIYIIQIQNFDSKKVTFHKIVKK